MAKHPPVAIKARKGTSVRPQYDLTKFENVLQIGGITPGTIESPPGSGQTRPVAMFNTGAGLRFNVALDRGGDIIDASFNQYSLTYLSPNGVPAPSHAYHRDFEWLNAWPAGLVTTCGPQYIGHARIEDDQPVSLHGHHSNTPAAVEMLINPDPHRDRHEMLLSMIIRDTRMFGPNLEVRRTIACTLGIPQIRLFDEVTNRADTPCAHNMLYHVNFGYPLLDHGTRLIYRGKASYVNNPPTKLSTTQLNAFKRVSNRNQTHVGNAELCTIIEPPADRDGMCHVGLLNTKLKLGVELMYPKVAMPRMVNWQHLGPRGCYVTAIEPFAGSLLGKANDSHPLADQQLLPGQTKRYQLTLNVHHSPAALKQLAAHDGPLTAKQG